MSFLVCFAKCRIFLFSSLADCTECEGRPTPFVIGFQIIVILIFISIIIAVNPRMSSDLRGPLFFLQIVFIVLEPNGIGWNFDFRFFQICAVKEMTSLGAVAMGYLFPFTTIIAFLFLYTVSAKFYLVRFKRRKNSILRSFWLLTLLAYNNLAITSFILLSCIKVGKKNLFFYDATIECFERDHLWLAILAIFSLLLMVILLISVVLVHDQEILESWSTVFRYSDRWSKPALLMVVVMGPVPKSVAHVVLCFHPRLVHQTGKSYYDFNQA